MQKSSLYSALIMFISIFILQSCTATISYLNDNMKDYPKTNAKDIKIYAERRLDDELIELGYVTTHTTQRQTEGDVLKEELQKEAAKLGADAVIGFRIVGYTAQGVGAEGIAVKFVDNSNY